MIFHTGYNPDISLFLRQARELGLRFDALIGHGAGYTDYTRIKQAVGSDANYFFDVDPISIWETNPKALKPELPPLIKMVGDAYMKAKPDTILMSPHLGMAASNTYLFLYDVLPRAIEKYGGVSADALRKAALDTDVPSGGTMLGFGAKFAGEASDMAGQNERAFPVVIQYIDDKSYVVWPKSLQQREPVLKLPPASPYAANDGAAVISGAGRRRADQALRRLHRRRQRVVQSRAGRDTWPDRPERLRQEHDLQHALRLVSADRGLDPLSGP